jgi:FAD/FMN-containing dehydrogenase
MRKRDLLKAAAASGLAAASSRLGFPWARATAKPFSRVRPGDPEWPTDTQWNSLIEAVHGRLIKVASPLDACRADPQGEACAALFKELRNPYFISDEVALTQTSGWIDAWTSSPSVYAARVRSTEDVVAAVNFAREKRLRLVIKGGGHSYLGTSNAANSLLIWTHEMNGITLHDAFVPKECDATHAPQPAVTVETGARWLQVYNAVTTRGGRYVQGGGCTTVGVGGFISGGGFGSFSKRFGMGAAGLLEGEIVTADGGVLTVNECNHPDLFWAIKGGGGGTFGVLTRLTLRTRELPETFGIAFGRIKANTDEAFRDLIARAIRFYAKALFNPNWGEQLGFGRDNALNIHKVFQGLTQTEAESVWAPFLAEIAAAPDRFTIDAPLSIIAMPARHFWDPAYLAAEHPTLIRRDDRPDAPPENIFNAGDGNEVGFFLHGYRSTWLPTSLLTDAEQPKLADAIFAASRQWSINLHFNKGLAGASAEDIAAARNTAMNPNVVDAFALAIIGAAEPPAFPGLPGHEPDLDAARAGAAAVTASMAKLQKVAPTPGSYLNETDYFEADWKESFWGPNYPRLAAVKKRYDPDGLFFTHHGVGSDEWSPDGFTRLVAQ